MTVARNTQVAPETAAALFAGVVLKGITEASPEAVKRGPPQMQRWGGGDGEAKGVASFSTL